MLKWTAIFIAGMLALPAWGGETFPTSSPEKVGMSPKRLENMTREMDRLVATEQIAGSVSLISRHGKVVYFKENGHLDKEGQVPMSKDTIFRIASMTKPITSVAHAVTDPQTGKSVAERRREANLVRGDAKTKKHARSSKEPRISALGSDSDYSPFFQHLTISSFNVGFYGEGAGGEYHTSFDTFDHYTRFKDPEGLPRRPWFKHQIYAPGFYTGYGVKTLPGIREGLEQEEYTEAQEQILITSKAIDRFTAVIKEANTILGE